MQIEASVMDVMDKMTFAGNLAFMPKDDAGNFIQLERQLYLEVDKVLRECGGKWNRSKRAHVFEGSASDHVDTALTTGEITTAAELGFFETPRDLVEKMLTQADPTGLAKRLGRPLRVLEPSAGRGAIALVLYPRLDGRDSITCIEIDEDRYHKLLTESLSFVSPERAHCTILRNDFIEGTREKYDLGPTDRLPLFDLVVMNPPFSRKQDIAHTTLAIQLLAPGGRLVGIMGAGVKFRSDNATVAFRRLLSDAGGVMHDLPPNSFQSSGTNVNTIMVVIEERQP